MLCAAITLLALPALSYAAASPPFAVPGAFVWSVDSTPVLGALTVTLTVRCGGVDATRSIWVYATRKTDSLATLRATRGALLAGRYGFRWEVDRCTSAQRAAFVADVIRRLRDRHDLRRA